MNAQSSRSDDHGDSGRRTNTPVDGYVEIDGVRLKLSQPYTGSAPWIGQREILMQLLACWITVDESDLPLTPRLVGSPGMGKTQLVIAAAKEQGLPLYIYQCTADTRPEDLLVTPVLGQSGTISYHASPLVSAMVCGGICLLDEGNRMNEKSWASLAPLFDGRRMVESIVAGIQIPASKDFRAAVTMNDDESTFEIPDYILSRLQPTLKVGFPNKQDEMAILQYHLPYAENEMLAMTVEFLQASHRLKLDFSPRDGINLLRYAIKRLQQDSSHPLSRDQAWREALERCLGEEASDLEELARRQKRALGGEAVPLGLADLFFDADDPMHPDRDEDDEYDGEYDDEDA
ncbi:MoxR family ATPase [Rubripirellula sp.]|nr:MoxR family ATPase [Rubripirellula sp.]